jgi:hypothetical protein
MRHSNNENSDDVTIVSVLVLICMDLVLHVLFSTIARFLPLMC